MCCFCTHSHIFHRFTPFETQVQEGVTRAIQHAKQFFLYDAERYFGHHKIWFKTLYRQESGAVTEALVMPPGNGAADGFGVILPVDVRPPTHQVTNPQDGKNYDVRLTVQVRDRGYFDPFDYRFGKSFLVGSESIHVCRFRLDSSNHYCPFCLQLFRHEALLPSGKGQQSMGRCRLSRQ